MATEENTGFSAAEKAAMKEHAAELRAAAKRQKSEDAAAAEAAKTAGEEVVKQGLTGEAANQFVQNAASTAYSDFAAKPFMDQAAGSFEALKSAPGPLGGLPAVARPAAFAGAGHFPSVEKAPEFAQALSQFLAASQDRAS